MAAVTIRRPHPHDLDAFARCVETGFAVRLAPSKREELVAGLDPERALAAFDGLELVGTLAGYPAELTVPGPFVAPALSLAEIAVLPTHRRRGVLTALLGDALGAGHARGDNLAVLASSEGGIYGRFGFAAATAHQRFVVERASASLVDPLCAPPRGRVVLLEPTEALGALPLVFDIARLQHPGELGRSPAYWEDLVSTEQEAAAPVRFFAFYEQDGALDGYAIYAVARDGEAGRDAAARRVVDLEECCTTSDAAYAALFAYLLGIDLTDRLRTGERPVDEPLRHMLADPRALRTTGHGDGLWVRLLDVAGAFGSRGYAADGRVSFELVDDFCPWNAGRYSLEVDAGTARVEATSAGVDLVLDAGALAACYLGGGSPVALRTAGRVVELVAGAAQRLERLLAWRPGPFCSTT